MPPPTHEANFSGTDAFISKLYKKEAHVLEDTIKYLIKEMVIQRKTTVIKEP